MRTSTDKALSPLTLLFSLAVLLVPWSAARAETCGQTVQFLQELYNRTVDVCPSGEPASSCSGIMLRGTQRANPALGQSWDIWKPNPQTVAKGASSYSYLRADINFPALAVQTTNGFIIAPTENLCQGQQPSYVQCAFPQDGWTWERGDRGCGDNKATVGREDHCQNLGITTGAAWISDFRGRAKAAGNQLRTQCGFDMSRGRGQAGRAEAFKDFLDARRLSNASEFQIPNELMVSNNVDPNILAFFYSDASGRVDALKNQADYLARTGEYRPVVRVQLPRTQGAKAQFFCDDQQMAFRGASRSPGFCKAGKAPTPGFGAPVGTPASPAAQDQSAQALQAAGVVQQGQVPGTGNVPVPSPQRCTQYIESATWVQRDEVGYGRIWSLSVTPTACGRQIRADDNAAMYSELVRKYGNDPRWDESGTAGTMYTQLVCHAITVRDKPQWNLEPKRVNLSLSAATTLPYACNSLPSDAGR